MTLLVRASHANEYELQNYISIADKYKICVATSHSPLTDLTLPSIALWSPSDLPAFPYRRQLLNRVLGGEQYLLGLEKEIKEGELVHTAETYTPYTHQCVKLRRKGYIRTLIATCWETIPHNNEKFARLRQWKHDAYKYIDHFHTPTERARAALIKEGVSHDRISVIPYGVDLARFAPAKKKPHKRLQVLTVARLAPEKGIAIVEQLAVRNPDLDFLVIGQGKMSSNIANLSSTQAEYNKIHTLYQQADIFLLPSITSATWEEQYGFAAVEALACGLPVITSDSGALMEVVRDAGIVVSGGTIAGYQRALTYFSDAENREVYGAKARDLAKRRYDPLASAARLGAVYNRYI